MKNQYDLILMDIRMPGMDGYNAFKKIRQIRNGVNPHVIATTAAGMKEDIAKIKRAGFSDYLIRPFNQEALVQLLMRYLPHDVTKGALLSQKQTRLMTAHAIKAGPPWRCPPEAKDYLLSTLKKQWEQVCLKQSIPDIIEFARDVKTAGDRYRIGLMSQYGKELAEYAEGFDIHNVEKLLQIYGVILSYRSDVDGEKA